MKWPDFNFEYTMPDNIYAKSMWINADYATVQRKVTVFTVDPESDISLFSLEKAGKEGSFTEISRLSGADPKSY